MSSRGRTRAPRIQHLSTITSLIELAQKMQRNGQPLSKDPVTRQKIAQFYIEANVGKYIGLRALTRQLRGQTPGPESSVGSLLTMELGQRIEDFAMYLQGSIQPVDEGLQVRYLATAPGREASFPHEAGPS